MGVSDYMLKGFEHDIIVASYSHEYGELEMCSWNSILFSQTAFKYN